MTGPSETIVSVDFTVDDSKAALVPFLERLGPLVGPSSPTPWRIDLSDCEYLGPDAAAILFALLAQARISNREWAILLPKGPPALVGFCRFSGLHHEIYGSGEPEKDHPASETVRLARFMKATWHRPDPVVQLVRRHFDLNLESEDYLRTCMGEVLQNIEDHSWSPMGGVLCARYPSATRQVRVAVVDRGLGILTTLRKHYPTLTSPMEALERVVQGGYSARSLRRNAGVGLRNLATFATAQGGNLTLVSGPAVLEMTAANRRPRVERCAFDFRGTAVFFTLNVDLR
jgi:hypothetical protein